MHRYTSVSRRLNILLVCIMFKIIAFFIITLFVRFGYMREFVFYSHGKRLHDPIISLRRKVWVHKTGSISPLFIEVPVPSQESEWSCDCVLRLSMLSLSTIWLLDFGTAPTVGIFCFWNCSDSQDFLFLELLRQLGFFVFGTAPTVVIFCFWNCSDSGDFLFLELLRQW